MVLKYTFKHNHEVVFNVIVSEALKAFKKPNLDRDKIKGLTLKTKIKNQVGQDVTVQQEVTDFVNNSLYELTTTSQKDRYISIYRLFPKGDKTYMEYEEKYYGSSLVRNLNQIVMSIVYRRKIKKRIFQIFAGIENLIEHDSH